MFWILMCGRCNSYLLFKSGKQYNHFNNNSSTILNNRIKIWHKRKQFRNKNTRENNQDNIILITKATVSIKADMFSTRNFGKKTQKLRGTF